MSLEKEFYEKPCLQIPIDTDAVCEAMQKYKQVQCDRYRKILSGTLEYSRAVVGNFNTSLGICIYWVHSFCKCSPEHEVMWGLCKTVGGGANTNTYACLNCGRWYDTARMYAVVIAVFGDTLLFFPVRYPEGKYGNTVRAWKFVNAEANSWMCDIRSIDAR